MRDKCDVRFLLVILSQISDAEITDDDDDDDDEEGFTAKRKEARVK